MSPAVHCSGCDRPAPEDPDRTAPVPWTWSVATEGDRQTYLCDECTRDHARSIEAMLDTEWW